MGCTLNKRVKDRDEILDNPDEDNIKTAECTDKNRTVMTSADRTCIQDQNGYIYLENKHAITVRENVQESSTNENERLPDPNPDGLSKVDAVIDMSSTKKLINKFLKRVKLKEMKLLVKAWKIVIVGRNIKNEKGKYSKLFQAAIIRTQEFEDHLEKDKYEINKEVKVRDLHNFLANIGAITCLCDFVADILKELRMNKAEDRYYRPEYELILSSLPKALQILVKFTDKGNSHSEIIRDHPYYLLNSFSQLKTWRKMIIIGKFTEYDEMLLIRSVTIIFNMSLHTDNIRTLQVLRCKNVLIPYLKVSKGLQLRLTTLATLANVIEDEESKCLRAEFGMIEYLIGLLEKAYHEPAKTCQGWAVIVLVKVIRRLSKHSYNRRALVVQGVIYPLVAMSETGSLHETREAAKTLWALSFDDRNLRDMIVNSSYRVVETMLALKSSNDAIVRKASDNFLLHVKRHLAQSQQCRELVADIFSRESEEMTPNGFVSVMNLT